MTNGIRKVRKGVDIFVKKILILVSSSRTKCFRIRPSLQLSFPCSRQSINRYHSAWWTTYQDSTLYVFNFLVSGKRKGEEREKETPPLCTIIFFFFQVGCTAIIFHTGFCSATRNWRELCKNLTVLSSLDDYAIHIEPDSIERNNVFPTS